jgi:hypothetical protein
MTGMSIRNVGASARVEPEFNAANATHRKWRNVISAVVGIHRGGGIPKKGHLQNQMNVIMS